ncbi:transporter [Bacteroidia bacterium]|nr:transporter [Bacteroidia bacterium]
MKKTIIILTILLPICGFAQQNWSLQSCIAYALEHNLQVKQSELSLQSSEISLKSAKNSFLPNISASLSDGFSFGRSQSRDGVYIDQNTNSGNAAIGADFNVFQGMRRHYEVKIRKNDLDAGLLDNEKIKNDISLNIASLYLNVLIQKELLNIAKEQAMMTDSLVAKTNILVNNGKQSISKLYEINAQKANDDYNILTCEKNLQLALLDLAQMLELENTNDFDIEEPNFDENIADNDVPAVILDNVADILPDVKAEERRLESSKLAVKQANSGWYPSISISANTNTGFYYYLNSGNGIANTPFFDQIKSNWRSYVGLSVNIPIFDRLETKNSVKLNKIAVQQQEIKIESAKKTLFKDIQKAILNAKVSKERFQATQKSVDANQEAYRFIEEQYNYGRSTIVDLQQSKNNLLKAQSEQIQAKYEFIFNTKVLKFYQQGKL